MSDVGQDALLEEDDFFVGHGIRLGNDGDQVDLLVESSHELDVDLSKTGERRGEGDEVVSYKFVAAVIAHSGCYSRMTGGLKKVETGMDSIVGQLGSVDSVLLLEVGIESSLDVLDDGLPAVVVVDEISVTWSVDDGETKTDAILLDVGTLRLDGYRLRSLLVRRWDFLFGIQTVIEEGIDQGRLA